MSRNYGFAKRTLSSLADKVGIAYDHAPELGIPGNSRKGLKTRGDSEKLFDEYRTDILPRQSDAIARVGALMRASPSALLCYEASPSSCHRRPLAEAVARTTGMKVVDLP